MNLFILGATGGIGTAVLEQALQHGHAVTAFVRSPEKITRRDRNLRVQKGDPHHVDQLASSMIKHDAVISALGTRSLAKRTLLEDCAQSTIEAMQRSGMRRLLVVSAAVVFAELWLAGAICGFVCHHP